MNTSNIQLQHYVIQSSGTPMFNISTQGQFIIQRKIFSDIYPDFQDLMTFKLYIYLCKSYEWKYKRIKKAKSQMQLELNLSRTDLDQGLLWLESNHFIKRTNSNKHQMYQAEILTAPDYDPFNQIFISCENIPFNISNLKARNHGYIMVPADAITNQMLESSSLSNRTWSYFKLKIYLLLYANCWLEYYGGINPDLIRIKMTANLIRIDPAFYYNAKGSEQEVVRTIASLLKNKLFKLVDVVYVNGVYVGDKTLFPVPNHSVVHTVLRPFHLSDKKVNADEMKEKRSFLTS